MTILDTIRERIYNGTLEDANKRHLYLAYLMLHMENKGMHPDDYLDPENGYAGWQAVFMYQVLHVRAATGMPDGFKYPTAFMMAEMTLDTFEGFHADDEEPYYTAIINDLRSFFDEMKPSELDGAVDSLQKLYLFHATEDEDNDYINNLRTMADVLNWIQHFSGR